MRGVYQHATLVNHVIVGDLRGSCHSSRKYEFINRLDSRTMGVAPDPIYDGEYHLRRDVYGRRGGGFALTWRGRRCIRDISEDNFWWAQVWVAQIELELE